MVIDQELNVYHGAKLLEAKHSLEECREDAEGRNLSCHRVTADAVVIGCCHGELDDSTSQYGEGEQIEEGYVEFFVPTLPH